MSRTTLAAPVFWTGIAACLIIGYLLAVAEFIGGTAFDDIAERWATR